MSVLPPEVLHEFQEGNFVVKRTDRRFNQVSADQSTEWLNDIGKTSGSLVGITRVASALSRMEKNDIDEGNIVVSLKLHGIFQDGGDTLKNLINKDVVHLRFMNLCLVQKTMDRHR